MKKKGNGLKDNIKEGKDINFDNNIEKDKLDNNNNINIYWGQFNKILKTLETLKMDENQYFELKAIFETLISKLEACTQKALNLEREVKEIKSMLYKTKCREMVHTFMKSFMIFLIWKIQKNLL